MTILIKDLDEVEAWQPLSAAPIPVGKHIATIDTVEEQPAATGSPQIVITWRVVAGEFVGTQSREWLVILPQTYGKVKAFLEAVNWDLKPGEFAMPTTELVGRNAVIIVGTEQRDKKIFTRVIGHSRVNDTDVPINTEGLPAGDQTDLPF
jgi:hypothetical protein